MRNAGLLGYSGWVNNFYQFADYWFGKGGEERVTDFDIAPASIGEQQYCRIHGSAVFACALVANDLGFYPACIIANKRQIASQRQRQSRRCKSEANPEDNRFDAALLS